MGFWFMFSLVFDLSLSHYFNRPCEFRVTLVFLAVLIVRWEAILIDTGNPFSDLNIQEQNN